MSGIGFDNPTGYVGSGNTTPNTSGLALSGAPISAANIPGTPLDAGLTAKLAIQQPQSPLDQYKNELVQTAQNQGASGVIPLLAKVDPTTAANMNSSLIAQKTSLMNGYTNTSDMEPNDYHQYLKDTKTLGDIASKINSDPDSTQRAVNYASALQDIKKIDPNAPNFYDKSYVNVAAMEANPINNLIATSPGAAMLFNRPTLTSDQVAAISGTKVAEKVGQEATLIATSDDKNWNVYQTTDSKGNQIFVSDNNGKVNVINPNATNVKFEGGGSFNVIPSSNPQSLSPDDQLTQLTGMNSTARTYANLLRSLPPVPKDGSTDWAAPQREIYEKMLNAAIGQSVQQQNMVLDQKLMLDRQSKFLQVSHMIDATNPNDVTPELKTFIGKDMLATTKQLSLMQTGISNITPQQLSQYYTGSGLVKSAYAKALSMANLGDMNSKVLGGISPDEYIKNEVPAQSAVQQVLTQLQNSAGARGKPQIYQDFINKVAGNTDPAFFKAQYTNAINQLQQTLDIDQQTVRSGKIPLSYSSNPMAQGVPATTPNVPQSAGNPQDFAKQIDAAIARKQTQLSQTNQTLGQ